MEYSSYCKGDEDGVVNLLTEVFDGWPKFDLPVSPVEHWKWKYLDSPTKGLITLAKDEGRVVGCSHTILKRIKVGAKTYLSGVGADAAVHKDYRDKGVYSSIRKPKDEEENMIGLRFRTSVSSNPKLIQRNYNRGNYEFPHRIVELNRIEDINLHYKDEKKLYQKIGYHLLSYGNKMKNLFTNREEVSDVDVIELKKFDDSVDEFWNKVSQRYNYIVVRDKAYLNWRYCDRRGGSYKILMAKSGESIAGFIVLRINRYDEEYSKGYIVDYLIDPQHPAVLGSLLSHSMSYFKDNNVNLVRSWNVMNDAYRQFSPYGFLVNPKKLHVFISKESIIEEELHCIPDSDPNNILFSFGDHDHI
ncbi:hypothetical protein JXL21_02075 [Candidatus Bathyarchaeota archaeon]|nr:hypothetical protein [Candidatus Bathyarchaeota archaeon]